MGHVARMGEMRNDYNFESETGRKVAVWDTRILLKFILKN
jgi:hypothetical protein